jgi:hypothetical protein
MSLALSVDVGGRSDGESGVTAAIGVLTTAVLLLAATEQFREAPAGRWWLALGCAMASALWCRGSWRRSSRRPRMRLKVADDGRLRLTCLDSGESCDAVFVAGWKLGRLIWLHLRALPKVDPAPGRPDHRQSVFGSGRNDGRFLLTRGFFEVTDWHALRRWLVWHGRSRGSGVVLA